MTFLSELDLDNVKEEVVVPEGEYKVKITGFSEGVDKNGNPYLLVFMAPDYDEPAKEFSYFLGKPDPNDDPRRFNRKLRDIKNFLQAFGLDKDSDPDSWVGEEAWALLGVKEDDEYGEQNYVKRFLV